MNILRKTLCLVGLGLLSCVSIQTDAAAIPADNEAMADSVAQQFMNIRKDFNNLYGSYPRCDANGKECALLRVFTSDSSGVSFEGDIVGDVEYRAYAYWVYMPAGSHQLTIKKDDKAIDLDLYRMIDKDATGLLGGVSYSMCGLDNDEYVSLAYYIDSFSPEDAKGLRDFAREYINAFNSGNLERFKSYYDSDAGLIAGNEAALHQMIDELAENNRKEYYAKCFPIINHAFKAHIYGNTVGFYDAEANVMGYSFLLLDLNDPDSIQNHISAFQTAADAEKDGVFTFEDFYIP